MKRLLYKATEEKEDFHDLIYKEVTFASDILTIGGQISHSKGEKAFISEVEYSGGYWSNLCPDIYVKPKISMFKINGIPSTCWRPDTFEEFRNVNLESNYNRV